MTQSITRRGILKGALAAAAIAPLAGFAGCASGGAKAPGGGTSVAKSADNPFGMNPEGNLEAVIFNGGFGITYGTFAGEAMKKKWPKLAKVDVRGSVDITKDLQPKFNSQQGLPDVFDNSGRGQIGLPSIIDQLDTFDDLMEAKNYEGKKIADTLYAGVAEAGTFNKKFVQFNYVMTAYGMWYSASLFKQNGWTPPVTWDDYMALGAKAKAAGKYLMLWGKEAATYFQTMVYDSAIKQGGDEVRLSFANLQKDCWSQPIVQEILKKLKAIIDAGYMKPGGDGTLFTTAQAQWSNAQEALLYPSGSWLGNEMKDQTKEGFEMTACPEPVLDATAKNTKAINASPGEPFACPTKSANPGAGKEFMRAMLSQEAAANFAKTIKSPTVVKGTVPDDGFGDPALQSLNKMLKEAGDNVFNTNYHNYYGTNQQQLNVWNPFLAGKLSVAEATTQLQKIFDDIPADKRIPFK